ncbi:helix-turn-helix domain-containing protein [Rhodococcus hoagii]|nr:helix-turn-helix domain-containing protein [Prescottella equi]MBM4594245.1 helix-turn-helix domain-containing protein [Prescottella equi]MBM4596024.1 helix-turn-helix domain-containing protein [Prescottella equi]MBM4608106.1 helix-turn-helix domain-containing protein [Prescottella equi]MBM4644233.1 helix-turn-helix domain-containing protein [Prescottella equi]
MNKNVDTAAVTAAMAAEIRRRRRELEWSQAELGNQAGLSRATIFRIEKLEREVSMDQLVRIAAAFDTTAGKIIRSVEESLGIE